MDLVPENDDIPDRPLTQAADSFQVLQQSDHAWADPRVICHGIVPVALLFCPCGFLAAVTKA
jgi:hypothetical protein